MHRPVEAGAVHEQDTVRPDRHCVEPGRRDVGGERDGAASRADGRAAPVRADPHAARARGGARAAVRRLLLSAVDGVFDAQRHGQERLHIHTGVPRSHQTSNIKHQTNQRKKRGIKAFSLFLPSPPASVVRGDISYIFIYRATIFVRPAFLAPPFFVARSAAWEEPPWDAAPRFLPPPFGRGDAFALVGFVGFVAFVVLVAAATAVVVAAAAAAADGDGDGASGSNGSASISCGAGAPTFEERDCA